MSFDGKPVRPDRAATLGGAGADQHKAVAVEVKRDKGARPSDHDRGAAKEVAQAGGEEEEAVTGDARAPPSPASRCAMSRPNSAPNSVCRAGCSGVVVTNIAPGSAADNANLEPGAVIIEINRQRFTGMADFKRLPSKLGRRRTRCYTSIVRAVNCSSPSNLESTEDTCVFIAS